MSTAASLVLPKILLIDDSPDDQFKLRWMLSKERRVDLYEASTAAEGAKLWQRIRPDLVFLDLNLPDEMGDQVMRRAKAEGWGDPIVVALSGLPLIERVAELTAAGVSGFVPKDRFTQELLSGLLRQVIERLQKRQAYQAQQTKLDQALSELASQLQEIGREIEVLAKPATQADSPGVRLLRGVLIQRRRALLSIAESLDNYANIEPADIDGQCTLEQLVTAVQEQSAQPVFIDSAVPGDSTLAADVESLSQILLPILDNAVRHDLGPDVVPLISIRGNHRCCQLIVRNLNPTLSAVWYSEPDELFRVGSSQPNSSGARVGLGLASVLKRVRSSSIEIATVLDPEHGFGIVVQVPLRS